MGEDFAIRRVASATELDEVLTVRNHVWRLLAVDALSVSP